MNILGINPRHNSSICLLSNGVTKLLLEEDRLSRTKHDIFPLFSLNKLIETIDHIDIIAIDYLYLPEQKLLWKK